MGKPRWVSVYGILLAAACGSGGGQGKDTGAPPDSAASAGGGGYGTPTGGSSPSSTGGSGGGGRLSTGGTTTSVPDGTSGLGGSGGRTSSIGGAGGDGIGGDRNSSTFDASAPDARDASSNRDVANCPVCTPMKCAYGMARDSNGCDTCQCNPAPDAAIGDDGKAGGDAVVVDSQVETGASDLSCVSDADCMACEYWAGSCVEICCTSTTPRNVAACNSYKGWWMANCPHIECTVDCTQMPPPAVRCMAGRCTTVP